MGSHGLSWAMSVKDVYAGSALHTLLPDPGLGVQHKHKAVIWVQGILSVVMCMAMP